MAASWLWVAARGSLCRARVGVTPAGLHEGIERVYVAVLPAGRRFFVGCALGHVGCEAEARKRPRSNSEEETRPSSARETGRPGRTKKQEPPPRGLEHPGTRGGGRPGLDHPGGNRQQGPRSWKRGQEGEAVEKQRSGVEDKAEEKRRNQDQDKAQVMQRCTQVDEHVGMTWSSQGNEAEEKQRSSKEEEREEKQ